MFATKQKGKTKKRVVEEEQGEELPTLSVGAPQLCETNKDVTSSYTCDDEQKDTLPTMVSLALPHRNDADAMALKRAIVQNLVCPISHHLFRDPVIAPDGFTYERFCIVKWMSKQETSPMTNVPMNGVHVSNSLISNHSMKQMVEVALQMYPELREELMEPFQIEILLSTTTFVQEQSYLDGFNDLDTYRVPSTNKLVFQHVLETCTIRSINYFVNKYNLDVEAVLAAEGIVLFDILCQNQILMKMLEVKEDPVRFVHWNWTDVNASGKKHYPRFVNAFFTAEKTLELEFTMSVNQSDMKLK
jgi:hypothetical protein